MKKRDTPCLQCPVGESDCEFLQELSELRRRNRELSELVRTDTDGTVFRLSLPLEVGVRDRAGPAAARA